MGKRNFLGVSVGGSLGRATGNTETNYYDYHASGTDSLTRHNESLGSYRQDSWDDSLSVNLGYLRKLSTRSGAELYARFRWKGRGMENSTDAIDRLVECTRTGGVPASCTTQRSWETVEDQIEKIPNFRAFSTGFLIWKNSDKGRIVLRGRAGTARYEGYARVSSSYYRVDQASSGSASDNLADTGSKHGTYHSSERSYYGNIGVGGTRSVGAHGVSVHWAVQPWFYQEIVHRTVETATQNYDYPALQSSVKEDVWYNEYSLDLELAVEIPAGRFLTLRFGNHSSVMYAKATTERTYPTSGPSAQGVRTESPRWPEGSTGFNGGVGFHLARGLTIDIYSLDLADWEAWKLQARLAF